MERRSLEELLLPASIISATITICCYFMVQYTHSDTTLRSLLIMAFFYIILAVICIVRIIKASQ